MKYEANSFVTQRPFMAQSGMESKPHLFKLNGAWMVRSSTNTQQGLDRLRLAYAHVRKLDGVG